MKAVNAPFFGPHRKRKIIEFIFTLNLRGKLDIMVKDY
jgi:hypothetical protein